MDVRALPTVVEEWIATRDHRPRTPGIHVSTLLVDMLKELSPAKYDEWGKGTGEGTGIYDLGFIWEDIMSAMLAERVIETDCMVIADNQEIERDGIIGTPDRLLLDADGLIDQETKVTWMRYRASLDDPKFLYWTLQAKTYCAMLGATRARIRALFVNELSQGKFVVPGAWELRWEQHELDEWWETVVRFSQRYR